MVVPLYNTFAFQKPLVGSPEPVHALDLLDPSMLPKSESDRMVLQTVCAMLNAGSR